MSLHAPPQPLPSSSASSSSFPSSSVSSTQKKSHPLPHDSPMTDQPGYTQTSTINPITSLPHNTTTTNTTTTATTTATTPASSFTSTTITSFHHQPLELINYSWPTNTHSITTPASSTTATSTSPTPFLTLDNSDQINLFLNPRTQPTNMTIKTDLSPSPTALPPFPSSSPTSQSSSSSPSSHQKPHPLFNPPHQFQDKMMNILPLRTNNNFSSSNRLSSIHPNHLTYNNLQPFSYYHADSDHGSRPSTAPTASFWSNSHCDTNSITDLHHRNMNNNNNNNTKDNITTIATTTPSSTMVSHTLTSSNLADLSIDDALSFPCQSHPNPPPHMHPNLNQIIPSTIHQPHPSLMMNPSQDLLTRQDLVSAPHYHHDLISSSPHSPSAGRLITHNPFHSHHLPILQHPYRPPSSTSSLVEHQAFPLPIHHAHPHMNGWNPSFDPTHLARCYDPFQIKHRRRTTPSQLSVLEAQFQTNCKPDVSLRKQLADQLDMTPREIQVWFQNRRAKTKKLERKAEHEFGKPNESDSIPNESRPATSPPASIYLSSPSLRGLALPVTHESPEDARSGVSPPRFVTSAVKAISEIDEGEQETQHRLESDRRYRSRSLHHHHPYYLPSLNTFNVPIGTHASNSLIGAATHNQQHQFGEGIDDTCIPGRRSSHMSNASSAATATDSNLLCTPTTTEFGSEHTGEFSDGYDPRRRSSCPAEFIQSFGHFGLAIGQSLDCKPQSGLESSFIPASQTCEEVIPPALNHNSAQFTMLRTQPEEWISKQHGYRNDATREGIQRRHSLATMNSPTESQGPNGQVLDTEMNIPTSFSSLFAMGTARFPTPVLSGLDSNNLIQTQGSRGGYVRRASTSVLKSIEEHPGNM